MKSADEAKPLGIDFGVNVLRWLPFGTAPQFASFEDKIVRNPVSTNALERLAIISFIN